MKRPLLVGTLAITLACLAGDALARSKKRPEVPDETAAAADSQKSDAAGQQLAAATTVPAAGSTANAGSGPARAGQSGAVPAPSSDPVSQRELAASCAKMISAAPDAATQRSIMQTCGQQLGSTPSDAGAAAEPPSSPPATGPTPVKPATTEDDAATAGHIGGKAGNFMLNFRLGYVPGVSLGGGGDDESSFSFSFPSQAVLGVEFAFAIQSQRKLYLIVPLTFQFQGLTAQIMLPFGVQYDIALPIKNLYVTPRMTVGYVASVTAISIGTGESMTFVGHSGLIAPEIGLKYILRGRMNLGIDLLSLPIVFNPAFAQVSYRVAVYLGANF